MVVLGRREGGLDVREPGPPERAEPCDGDAQARHEAELVEDEIRVEGLRAAGPGSETVLRFERHMREYALGTVMTICATDGGLIRKLRQLMPGMSLPSPPLHWDHDVWRSLASTAIAKAAPRFMEKLLSGDGWNAHGGTTIKSFFVNACCLELVDVYRQERRALGIGREEPIGTSADLDIYVMDWLRRNVEPDPEVAVLDRDEIRRLLSLASHKLIPEIIFLRFYQDRTQREIAARLNTPEYTVSKLLTKFYEDARKAWGGGER
jgi:DNA-directed RNA polymerase specialized sigma24 family protein